MPRALTPDEQELLRLCSEAFSGPGRPIADSARAARVVKALVEHHGWTKKAAIWALIPEDLEVKAAERRFEVIARAYQKLIKSGRFSYVGDRSTDLRSLLERLKGKRR
jgi:hypothetical protein